MRNSKAWYAPGYFVKYILFIIITVIMLLPFYWIFITSFKVDKDIYTFPIKWWPSVWTLKNFFSVMETSLPLYFLNSVIISIFTVVISLGVGSLAGYGFSRFNWKGKTVLLVAILGTQMMPRLINIIPLYLMMNKVGLLNTRSSLIIVYGAMLTPIVIWFMKSFFDTVPKELDEAALIDGCSRFQIFFRIILPLAKPGLAAVALLAFMQAWNEFPIALIFITKEAIRPLSVGIYSFIGNYGQVRWGQLSAASIIAMLPTIAVFLMVIRQFVSGLVAGAIKQ